MTNFQEARDTHARALDVGDDGEESKYYMFVIPQMLQF